VIIWRAEYTIGLILEDCDMEIKRMKWESLVVRGEGLTLMWEPVIAANIASGLTAILKRSPWSL
jgi:hypothetical protein